MTPLAQRDLPTVGDTIWVDRTVALPAGRTLRAADWQPSDPVELLGPPRVTLGGGTAQVSYPVAVWRAGSHEVRIPGPLLLAADGGVDSLASQPVTLTVGSVLPRTATDTSLRPQPRAEFVSRPTTTPVPLLIFLVLALALLVPLHRWWWRRGKPVHGPAWLAPSAPNPPIERWADAGESRAVAAAATARLRAALASRLPGALASLDTDGVIAHVAEHRPDWPVAELEDVLRRLDRARFGTGSAPDAAALAHRASALEPRLFPEAA